MARMKGFLTSVVSVVFLGCGVPDAEHQAVLAQVDSLMAVVDELENGAARLSDQAEAEFNAGNYAAVGEIASRLSARHPGSSEAEAVEALSREATTRMAEAEAERQRAAEAARRAEEERIRRAVASLHTTTDDVEGVTRYWDRSSSQYVNTSSRMILFMIEAVQGRPSIYMRVQYSADDWLFVERFTLNVDGTTYRISPGFQEVERDNGSGGIWEWYTTRATEQELRIARAVIGSESAVLRYEGDQYYRDRTITSTEKRGMQNILDAYEALTGGG